jgi:TonB-dependent siderophore receptor
MNVRVSCILVCMLAFGLAWSAEPSTYRLKIPEQSLGDALQEFSRQSGVQIIFFSGVTEGLTAPALDGQYTMSAALGALLANSKLRFRVINAKTVEVTNTPTTQSVSKPGAAAQPRATKVRSNAGASNREPVGKSLEEVVVTGTAEGLVATRTATPLSAIPQTVSIMSREQIRQENQTDLGDALARATGITVVQNTSMDELFYSRGYQITTFHVDGGAALTSRLGLGTRETFLGTPDLSEFDHIEVLRGADALFGGTGFPGGTVSMVRKRPLDEYTFALNVWGGNWNDQRIEVDVTGPLARDGALRGRLDGVYADRRYFYDNARLERRKIFAVLEYDFTPNATVTLGGSYQKDDSKPLGYGLPMYADGSDTRLARDTALTLDWSRYGRQTRELYVQYRQEFASAWAVKFNAAQWRGTTEWGYGAFAGSLDPITQTLRSQPDASFSTEPNMLRQVTADLTLTGTFDWLGMRHEIAFGGDFTQAKLTLVGDDYFDFGPAPSDLLVFDASAYVDPRGTSSPTLHTDAYSKLRQKGLFASWRTYLNEDWSIVAGARIGGDSAKTGATLTAGPINVSIVSTFDNARIATPYAGVMVDLDDRYSLYASYAAIYLSLPETQRADGTALPTRSTGADIEVGIKASWRNGALNGALVLYQADQFDMPVMDLSSRRLAGDLFCCFRRGTNTSEGVDLELSGAITPGWLIGGGYTFNQSESAAGGALSIQTPRHLLKLWTSRQLPGLLDRWTVGGSLHAQSSTSSSGSFYCPQPIRTFSCAVDPVPVHATQDGYAVVDLRVGFQVNPNWHAALTVGNVFDEIYYQTLGASLDNNWYGEPRSYTLRIEGRY